MTHLSDIEIANSVTPRPIEDIAASVGLKPQNLFRYTSPKWTWLPCPKKQASQAN